MSEKPQIEIPFTSRHMDWGEWVWDHRVGLCVMVIVYLVAGIAFMTVQIVVGRKQPPQTYIIEVETARTIPEEQITEEQRVERIERGDDFSQIRNRVSNENAGATAADLNPALGDDRGVSARRIYDEAEAVLERTRANREAYEEGLAQVGKGGSGGSGQGSGGAGGLGGGQSQAGAGQSAAGQSSDTRSAGKVTVSFSLVNPIRYSSDLFIPAYKCRGGGELILDITVNRNGNVTAASLQQASSSVDDCMVETAIKAAFASRFDINSSAPEKHRGTISYVFIPQ